MKVLVAGASGAIGKQLVPRLVAAGHSVTGLTRSTAGAEEVRALGGEPAIADALDPEAVARAVAEAGPEAIVHELTSLSASLDMRHFDRDFALTNRLRTEGTDHLLSAAHAVGVRRFVAQSFAGWNYARSGGPVKSEDDPLDPEPAAGRRGGDGHDDRSEGRVQREGEAGADRDRGGRGLTDPREKLLAELRPGAFAVAYRMLGSVSEAEDVRALRGADRVARALVNWGRQGDRTGASVRCARVQSSTIEVERGARTRSERATRRGAGARRSPPSFTTVTCWGRSGPARA